MQKPILYSYFRSSCSYRVRIALNLKEVKFETRAKHLVKGENNLEDYKRLNPMGQVPFFVHDGVGIAQSMAIIEYIDQVFSSGQSLFPKSAGDAARVRQICEMINSGIQPHQNLSTGIEMKKWFGIDDEQKTKWWAFWIERGFVAIEKVLEETAGNFAFGDQVTAADAFIVPQVFNAKRFNLDMSKFPLISKVSGNAESLEAFKRAHPSKQPDSES
ncbi:MAG: maleylacetoacetate isomerase [Bdellovibrionales bacterium]|nr:maleylacetoacetate isomerase [Bdellovibrionales bacterium]